MYWGIQKCQNFQSDLDGFICFSSWTTKPGMSRGKRVFVCVKERERERERDRERQRERMREKEKENVSILKTFLIQEFWIRKHRTGRERREREREREIERERESVCARVYSNVNEVIMAPCKAYNNYLILPIIQLFKF